ncbi:MAG: GAF domain-containing protein [Chitinispirillaceae bacterium]|nr:GAF domain-containing protein [Chitinispirillaceae bacterium]
MSNSIVVFGALPEADLVLLRAAAKEFGIDTVKQNRSEKLSVVPGENPPSGYVSYLPPDAAATGQYAGLAQMQESSDTIAVPFFQCIDGRAVPDILKTLPVAGVFVSPLSVSAAWTMLSMIAKCRRLTARNKELISEGIRLTDQKKMLIEIGTALSREYDLNPLLEIILHVSRDMVSADAGSIYIRERSTPGGPFVNTLRFKVTQNNSVDIGKLVEFQVKIDQNSIAGHVAFTGKPLKIDDVNAIDPALPYKFQKNPDYWIKSMLTLPLRNKDGEVVGVLQLMNKKRDPAAKIRTDEECSALSIPFSIDDQNFVQSVAGQAAVSIERAQLYDNIRELFEGFLNSSIAAIDERDRVTSGHSKRVKGYAAAFVEAAAAEPHGLFSAIAESPARRRQFQFAALLHDIGKIGVPERLLTKESRIPRREFDALLARLDLVDFALRHDPASVSWVSAEEAAEDRRVLEKINNAGRLGDDDLARLALMRGKQFHTANGTPVKFLKDDEWESLSVRAGNLTPGERELINSHALATYRILSKIPWTRELEMIPTIAATHHEKMDGSGYPHGLKGEEISLESRILAVIDIYEALVAQDRPYKPKMAPEKALAIINQEVAAGHLDGTVVKFFIEKEIFRLYIDHTAA